MVSWLLKLLSIKIKDTKLGVSLKVLVILLNNKQKVWNWCIFIFRILLQSFGHSEIGIHRIWINSQSMFEILDCSLSLCQVREQVSQMDTGTKVVLVDLQAFLVVQEALLELLLELVCLSQIEESAWLWSFLWILYLKQQRLLDNFDSFFASFLFDKHLTL